MYLLDYLSPSFQSFVVPAYITAPFTQIQNRAQVLDTANMLQPLMGLEPVVFRHLTLLQKEFGPNGEPVFESSTKDSRWRFVGSWLPTSGSAGINMGVIAVVGDYFEGVFYGTGLNIVGIFDSNTRDVRVTVDNGAEGTNIFAVGAISSVLNGRNSATNQTINIVSGLTRGWHTVKLRVNQAAGQSFPIYGAEVINESATMAITPGVAFADGKKESLNSLTVTDYKAGITGSRGARVVKYLKDGAISQAVTEVGTAKYLANTDHSNEEAFRRITPSSMGNSLVTDFSTLVGTASNRYHTMEDETTSLIGFNVSAPSGSLSLFDNTSYVLVEFVGTGLDFISISGTGITLGQMAVDNVIQGNYGRAVAPGGTVKLCSGLPYGSHMVRLTMTVGGGDLASSFIVYQPKKPSIPIGAIERADYNVVADYVPNSIATGETIAQGVIRKRATRRFQYVGNFSTTASPGEGGSITFTVTAGNTIKHYFYGVGFEYRPQAASGSVFTIAVNGSTNLSALTTGVYGANITLTASTGTINQSVAAQSGQGVIIRGLPLQWHTVTLTKVSGGSGMAVVAFDAITPIHANDVSLRIPNLGLISNNTKQALPFASGLDTRAKAWLTYDQSTGIITASHNIANVYNVSTGITNIYFVKPFKAGYVANFGGGFNPQTNLALPDRYQVVLLNNSFSAVNGVITISFYGELIDE